MEQITVFLSNPIVGLVGYGLSAVSSVIAIWQFVRASKANGSLKRLEASYSAVVIENSMLKVGRDSNINMGDKSQYFPGNNGPVSIDIK